VLPFSVRGGQELAYLGEGMVSLLGTKLDGAGGLRRVDPHSLLSFVKRHASDSTDPEAGRTVAQQFGAGLYVLGSVVELPGRVHIEASLYDVARGDAPMAEASAEGEVTRLTDLVDALAADLLKSRIGEAGAAFMRVGARTTDSFPALKAYLEGESAHRAGRWKAAQEAFERAVAADPSFSLAYLRLSDAAGWGLDPEASHHAAEQALQHRGRLSEHDRLLVEAQFACVSGAVDEAERRYRTLLGVYPEDWQAWWWLGETLYHFNPLRGRSVREAREPLERALDLDPTMWEPLTHLMHVAAIDGDRPRLRSLLERYLGFEASSEGTIRQRALGAFALGDRASQEAVLADLARASDFELGLTPDVVLHGGDLRAAEEVARLLTDPTRAAPMRATGHAKLAHLALARGRWGEARAELAAAARFDPATALEYRALLSATSFLRLPRVELEELRAEVGRWNAAALPASAHKSAWSSPHEGRHVELRAYLLGALSVRLGDSEAALRKATELERGEGSAEARALAGSLRAQAARLGGEAAEALDLIEKAALQTWLEYPLASPFWSQAYERFLRAELLQELGRHEEALGWYATFEEHTVFDRVYHAPALLRSGEIYEEIGEREKARRHYERFAALWRDSDPELRPLVAEAEERLRGIDAPSSRRPSQP
jgi:tetratricopeptide (TPR) repeat protein